MNQINWPQAERIFATILVDPALPIRMTFFFFPNERVNDPTDKGRIGDLDITNDIVPITADQQLRDSANPYLTFIATLHPSLPGQNSYDFKLVFLDKGARDALVKRGRRPGKTTPLATIHFKDVLLTRFKIFDERIPITFK